MLKNLLAMQETRVRTLGRGNPLEKGMATRSSIWLGEFYGLYSPWGLKELDATEQLLLSLWMPTL